MKRTKTFTAMGLTLLLLLAAAIPASAAVSGQSTPAASKIANPDILPSPAPAVAKTGTIEVTGKGQIRIQPDVAYVNIGVQMNGATAKESQAAAAKSLAEVKRVLTEKFGIPAKDIKTSGFYVYPQYDYADPVKGDAPKPVGYTASHTVQVTYRNLDNLGALLDAAAAAGANQMNDVQFGTEKAEAYELQLIDKAMASADKKAAAFAKAAGKSVKGVLSISQAYTDVPVVWGGHSIGVSYAKSAEDAATSIEAGELTLSTTVTVTYEMQ